MTRQSLRFDTIEEGSKEDQLIAALAPGHLRPENLRDGLDLDNEEILDGMDQGALKFKVVAGVPVFKPEDVIRWVALRAG